MNVKEIFETMEYGPAPESSTEAHEWLEAMAANLVISSMVNLPNQARALPLPIRPRAKNWPKSAKPKRQILI